MRKSSAELEPAAIILDDQHPCASLARNPYQHVLRSAMAADVSQRLPQNSGNFSTSGRRKADLCDVTNELRTDAGVLAIACDHAREKIHYVAGIKVERLELLDQVAHVRRLALHQLLDVEQLLFAFGGADGRTSAQGIQPECDCM